MKAARSSRSITATPPASTWRAISPTRRKPTARAATAHPVTQLEWARKGVITKEMIYVAERENLGRKKMLDVAQERA